MITNLYYYSWQQVFPAGEKIKVKYSYNYPGPLNRQLGIKAIGNFYSFGVCADSSFLGAIKRKEEEGFSSMVYSSVSVKLSLGSYWAGEKIGNFNLIVDKGKPQNLVTFCANGVKKISQTQFKVNYQNFMPKDDLTVIFLSNGATACDLTGCPCEDNKCRQ